LAAIESSFSEEKEAKRLLFLRFESFPLLQREARTWRRRNSILTAVEHTIDATDVGDWKILKLPVVRVDQSVPAGTDTLIGLDFLKRVHVWISQSSSSLIMQYPPSSSP
jgi:hypothetical protein